MREKLIKLTMLLNEYRDAYYNAAESKVTDAVYDKLYEELEEMEAKLGYSLPNSPTKTVGYEVKDILGKVQHSIPLLSMAKTKAVEEIVDFVSKADTIQMLKLDGLTVELEYEKGVLKQASTRGNGIIGEDITHNMPYVKGIPLILPEELDIKVTGEAFIRTDVFNRLKETLTDNNGKQYRNGRNLASGAIRSLNSKNCEDKCVEFMPFKLLTGWESKDKISGLQKLSTLGFNVCPYVKVVEKDKKSLKIEIKKMQGFAESTCIPIDGIIYTYTDIAYSESLGATSHHYRDGVAYKFEDELVETTIKEVIWQPSRTGQLTPVGVFEPVDIYDSEVSRATLHNLSIVEEMNIKPKDRVLVTKRNMIIPHIEANLDKDTTKRIDYPKTCPVCQGLTEIKETNDKGKIIKVLYCTNENCGAKNLKQLEAYVSKNAMNIRGVSGATLKMLVDNGWVKNYSDLYNIGTHKEDIIRLEGYGEKAYQKMYLSIESSKDVTLDRLLVSLNIQHLGKSISKVIAQEFSSAEDFLTAIEAGYDFTQLKDVGGILHEGIHDWFSIKENKEEYKKLLQILRVSSISKSRIKEKEGINLFSNKTIVITGKLEHYTREGIITVLEDLGAKVTNNVSSKTAYLIVGKEAGSKLSKAKSLGVKVINEKEFEAIVNKI